MIAGDLAARTNVAITWTRGIRSTDLDMRAVVLRVITVGSEEVGAGNAEGARRRRGDRVTTGDPAWLGLGLGVPP
jgi:hypothetical protein